VSDERLTPERAARLLRAKASELEAIVRDMSDDEATEVSVLRTVFAADIALVASLLADEIERRTE
jgi:ParB-like chromosome segregation protein Spo0J